MTTQGVTFSIIRSAIDDDWTTIAAAEVITDEASTVSVAVSGVTASDMQAEIRARRVEDDTITNVQIISSSSTANQLLGSVNAPIGVSTVHIEAKRIAGSGSLVLLNRAAGIVRAGSAAVIVDPGEIPPTVITVQPPATITRAPGVLFNLSAQATGQNVQGFLQTRSGPGAAWSETSTQSLSWDITPDLADDGRQYRFRITGDDGAELFTTITTLAVSANAPVIIVQPQNVTAAAGGSASWTAQASGTGPFTWEAFYNGSTIGSGTGTAATYTRSLVVPGDDGGTVRFDFTNAGGTVQSQTATLNVTTAAAALDLLITDIRIVGN